MNIIAVDFDGTLAADAFPEIGQVEAEHEKVHRIIKRMKKEGSKLILWTCRTDTKERKYLTEAVEWCKSQGIHFDYVNENPENPYGDNTRKVFADVYIDDRAINPISPYMLLE